MTLLSSYRENNRTANVYYREGRFVVVGPDQKETEYSTEFAAENAAEDSVLTVVDSGPIVARPPRG
jgi:hypothetical protein